jgi:3,4-dihydroxy 2-butanone 4-phosphate synthase/GTP cyclohydrolase II
MVPIEALLSGAREHRQKTGRPLVTLSYAQSLDGSIAARRGSPLRLSGPEAMALTHRLRAAHGAILVGIGTVLADDPRLNVRLVQGRDPQPVVLDSRLRMPLEAELMRGACPPWIATLAEADPHKRVQLEQRGARVFHLPPGETGGVSLAALLERLGEWGIDTLMVEGGASVITAFFRQALVDRLVLTIAPRLVGGLRAIEMDGESVGWIGSPPNLQNVGYERLGDDLIVWGSIGK